VPATCVSKKGAAYRALTVRFGAVTRTVGRATMEEEAMANMLFECSRKEKRAGAYMNGLSARRSASLFSPSLTRQV